MKFHATNGVLIPMDQMFQGTSTIAPINTATTLISHQYCLKAQYEGHLQDPSIGGKNQALL